MTDRLASPGSPTAPPGSRRARVAPLDAVVGTAVALAVVAMGLAALHTSSSVPVEAWQVALLLCMLPLSELALLHVRFGGDSLSFTWGEGALLVGFAMTHPSLLVLVAGPMVLLVHLLKRRGLQKAAYNAAAFTLSAGMAGVVLELVTEAPYLLSSPRDVAGLAAAALVFSATSLTCTGVVVSVAQRKSLSHVLVRNLRMVVLVSLGNLAAAGLVLYLAEQSRATLFALPPVMLAMLMVYRGYLRAGQERDVWRQLEAASRELNHLDEERVALAALVRVRELMRANGADLLLHGTETKPARSYEIDGDRVTCRPIEALEAVLRTGPGAGTLLELRPSGRKKLTTSLLSPLEGPNGTMGALRLHFSGTVHLTSREQQVLSTFTHAVASSLLNVALHEDVRNEARKQAHQAMHDPLTGLANRTLLRERTEQVLSEESNSALLLIDLDHFKEINDTLGHAAGDLLLEKVGHRLRDAVREGGLVSRLGGDEFAILLTDLRSPADAGAVAERILHALSRPVDYQGLHLSVEGSIGVACYPQDAQDAGELFRRADVAMYQAKADRGSWLRYDPLKDDSSIERLALVAELREALEKDHLVVHYQPQRDLETGQVVGAEALVRWQHPVRGLLYPGAFVGVAEQSGLVRPFTLKVLELAVAECVRWQALGRPLSVAVNLGARSLLDRRLPDDVAEVLSRYGLAPDRLVLEITETTAASELEIVEEVLGRLRRLGVEISVDDFGTGYSSLSFLQRTSVHELKVDRSFVAGMLESDNDIALVRATIQLAHSLGARAVAEGVESQALQLALVSLGCDVAQGYHLGRPMPSQDFLALLAASAVPVPRADSERHLRSVLAP